MPNEAKPIHPGKYLYNKIIKKGITIVTLAESLGVTRNTISRILNGHCGISIDMALRLSKLIPNTKIKHWLDLQQNYDIWIINKKINKIKIKPLEISIKL